MNKYRKNESRNIKAVMRSDPSGRCTYKQARKLYRSGYIWTWELPELV